MKYLLPSKTTDLPLTELGGKEGLGKVSCYRDADTVSLGNGLPSLPTVQVPSLNT